MPGSPPINTAEPGTNPPPATRSSSPMPVTTRAGCGSPPVSPTSLPDRPLGRLAPLAPEAGIPAASSMMVFHSPQLSHRPDHLAWTAPQDWQTKLDEGFAIQDLLAGSPRAGKDSLISIKEQLCGPRILLF